MNAFQLITYCSLAGTVDLNKRLKGKDGQLTDFYMIRMSYRDKRITFQYHKDGDNLTFIKGNAIQFDPNLGAKVSEIHGFKHLMKTMNIL